MTPKKKKARKGKMAKVAKHKVRSTQGVDDPGRPQQGQQTGQSQGQSEGSGEVQRKPS